MRGQRGDIGRAPQQLDIGMTADHTTGRAGRVEQDAVIGLAVPPAGRRAGIADQQRGTQAQALQIGPHPFQARRVLVQGSQLQIGNLFQQMPGLAARRGAGIQHPLTGFGGKQRRGQLRGGILHRNRACGEARQRERLNRLVQNQGTVNARDRRSAMSGCGEQRLIIGAAVLAGVDPQGERWPGIVGSDQIGPVVRPVPAQALQQPARVRGLRVLAGRQGRSQFSTPAHSIAQQCITQTHRPGTLQGMRGGYGFGNGGVLGHAQMPELIQAHQQQGAHRVFTGRQRSLQQQIQQCLQLRLPAAYAIAEFLQQAAIAWCGPRQRRWQHAGQ